jgi:glycerol-3-phosphate O-acyltransferase
LTVANDIDGWRAHGNPWPEDRSIPIHFVVYGDDSYDHDLVRQWIAARQPSDSKNELHYAAIVTAIDDTPLHEGLSGAYDAEDGRLVIPVGVAWTSGDKGVRNRFSGGAPKSRRAKERALKKYPERCVMIAGAGATIAALRARFHKKFGDERSDAAFEDFIARQAALTIDRDVRRIDGVSLKLPRFVVPSIMTRSDFRAELRAIAADTGQPLADIEQRARACLREIAPSPSPLFVKTMARFMRALCGLGYDPDIVVDETQAKEIAALVRNRPAALLFTHKSHVDGGALIHFAHERRFPLLHMIGGINMAFFGLGSLAKKSGAIFIRRSFQDDLVYKACLRHYLAYILEKRFPVAWSLEGTRSRIGKLMPPRYGILKYVVEAAQKNGIEDLQLVPVSIYYDLIPEIDSYASEQSGATKRKESFAWFVGFVAGMRKPLGRIFMTFGEPVPAALVDETDEDAKGDAFSLGLQKIAFQSAVNINDATPITTSGLLSFVMINAAPQALTDAEISADLARLQAWALKRNIPMTDDLKTANARKIRKVAQAMIDVGVLKEYDGGLEPLYGIAPGQEFTVSYYRNTILHFFVLNGIIELALARAMSAGPGASAQVFWDETAALRDLFKFEFFYPPKDAFKAQIQQELSTQNPDWENMLNAGGGAVETLLESLSPIFAHGGLKPYIEAYSVVSEAILRLKPGESGDEKSIIATCLKLGKEAVLRRRITGEESVAKLFFSNGYKIAANRGLFDDDRETSGKRVAFAREMRDLQRRLRLIEAIDARRRSAQDLGVIGVVEKDSALRAAQ